MASDAAVVKDQERELESQMAEETKAVTCNFWLGERLKWDFFCFVFNFDDALGFIATSQQDK